MSRDVLYDKCPNCGEPGPHFVPPSLGEPGFFLCDRPTETYLTEDREQKMDALIDILKDSGPVCDGTFQCPGWETDPGAETDKYCKHCGRERIWRDKT